MSVSYTVEVHTDGRTDGRTQVCGVYCFGNTFNHFHTAKQFPRKKISYVVRRETKGAFKTFDRKVYAVDDGYKSLGLQFI